MFARFLPSLKMASLAAYLDPERAELERQIESLRRDVRQLQLEHDILRRLMNC